MNKQSQYLPQGSPTSSPWGQIENSQEIAPGVWSVSTPGHGGIMIHKTAMKNFSPQLPLMSKYGGKFGSYICFEEDVEAGAVILELLEQGKTSEELGYRSTLNKENIIKTLQSYYPEYIKARGLTITPKFKAGDIVMVPKEGEGIKKARIQTINDDLVWVQFEDGKEDRIHINHLKPISARQKRMNQLKEIKGTK